jgi:hypothetical protein
VPEWIFGDICRLDRSDGLAALIGMCIGWTCVGALDRPCRCAIGSDLDKGASVSLQPCRFPRKRLPALDGHIDISRIELDGVADAADNLRRER